MKIVVFCFVGKNPGPDVSLCFNDPWIIIRLELAVPCHRSTMTCFNPAYSRSYGDNELGEIGLVDKKEGELRVGGGVGGGRLHGDHAIKMHKIQVAGQVHQHG